MANNYSFSKKFIEGEGVSGFWNIVWYAVAGLNTLLVIYFLSIYEFGLYQLILAALALGESLTAGFVDDIVAVDLGRYFSQSLKGLARRLLGEYSILKMGLGVFLSLMILGGAQFIAGYYSQDIAGFLQIVAVVLVFRVALSVFKTFFNSQVYFGALKAPVIGEMVKFIFLLLLLPFHGLGITQVLLAYLVGHVATFIITGWHFLRLARNTFRGIPAVREHLLLAEIKQHSVWLFFRFVISRIANNIRPWVIKLLTNTETVAIFTIAKNFAAVIMRLMPLGTFQVLLPREIDDPARVRYLFTRVIKYSFWLAVILGVGSFFIVPIAVGMILPKYLPAMPLFRVMILVIVLYGLYKPLRSSLTVFKEYKILALRSFDQSLLAPLLLFILLPFFGSVGAAMEWVITYAVTTLVFYVALVRKHPNLKLQIGDLLVFDRQDGKLIGKIWQNTKEFLSARLHYNSKAL